MTMDALISIRHNGEVGKKKQGDVLNLKPSGSAWSAEEMKFHLVVDWVDATKEAELDALPEGSKLLTLPYATYDADDSILIRSTKYVHIGIMNNPQLGNVLDRTAHVDKLRSNQYTKKTRN
tara:strand:+ start:1587 stop:1949 length:363 start_codon:yes stop_codon:yes gene_type:complete